MRRRGRDIVAAIERGRDAPSRSSSSAEERLRPESGDGPVIALAESLVRARALEAGLAYELIAARADLRADRRRRSAAALEPPACARCAAGGASWSGDELLALLRGERTLAVEGGRVDVTAG